MIEKIDIYDDLGQKTTLSLCKDKVHKRALIHRGVCVWIMNSRNELLLQTRSCHVVLLNFLDISFSGHIKAGETSLQAVIREGQEELGIQVEVDKLKYLFSCREYGGIEGYFENEIDDVFLYRADIPIEAFTFCDDEVKEVSYVTLAEFETMVQSKSPLLVPYETHYQFLLTALSSSLLRYE